MAFTWTCDSCTFSNAELHLQCDMCRAIRTSSATATATVSESVSPSVSVFVSESTANFNLNLNLSPRALDEAARLARLARIEAKHPAPAPASEQLPQLLPAIPSLALTLTPTPTPIQNYATPSAYQHADRIHWNNAVPISRYISEFRPSAVSIHQEIGFVFNVLFNALPLLLRLYTPRNLFTPMNPSKL
ncbi:hypothetical protein HDU99_008473, partial [Rhizoclosmatium hyalinum]